MCPSALSWLTLLACVLPPLWGAFQRRCRQLKYIVATGRLRVNPDPGWRSKRCVLGNETFGPRVFAVLLYSINIQHVYVPVCCFISNQLLSINVATLRLFFSMKMLMRWNMQSVWKPSESSDNCNNPHIFYSVVFQLCIMKSVYLCCELNSEPRGLVGKPTTF